MTFVKICGITNLEDATVAVELGADALGFNFYKKSPRYISPERAKAIIAHLPDTLLTVGVFVDSDAEEILEITEQLNLGAIQLHGTNPLDTLGVKNSRAKLIAALRLSPEVDSDLIEKVAATCEFLLVDSYVPGEFGGTGQLLPLDKVKTLIPQDLLARTIIAGGLTPENVGQAVRALNPFGVDVASGVEITPGKKNTEKIKIFIDKAKRLNL